MIFDNNLNPSYLKNYQINYNKQIKKLEITINKKPLLSFDCKSIIKNFQEEKNTLTFLQMKSLIYIALSIKTKRPCIIQGTYLVKLISNILGRDLDIYQMNKDNQLLLITKGFFFCRFF